MKHLIGKHTHPGELVIEPFGGSGSGSACRAAAELGRHWVYCETNAGAFDLGSVNIANTIAGLKTLAG